MGRTLVIAECGSTWDCDLSKAYKLIDAVKECGADVAKFQWTSNAKAMAERRLGPNAVGPTQMYKRYLEYPQGHLMRLKAHCDSVGIEFACTVYLIEDIAVIAPLVKRFKVSAFESQWDEFVDAHGSEREIIVSLNPVHSMSIKSQLKYLHCISKYPTPIEELKIINCRQLDEGPNLDGLSDHTTSTLSGAVAVGCGATIIEKHVMSFDTLTDNPDYPHSLACWTPLGLNSKYSAFGQYVSNVREAERML